MPDRPERTRLTKTGQPVMGTTIEVLLTDGEWEPVKIVGKGFGADGHRLVMAVLEFDDGSRTIAQPFGDVEWRSVKASDG